MSYDHLTVDGTLIEAWASQKSFQKKDDGQSGGDGANFPGHKRSNQTHASTTDPESKQYRKGLGQEAKLSYLGHVLMENRNGLIVDAMVTEADGTAERDEALLIVHARRKKHRPISSLRADKGYDTRDFVKVMREMEVRPHVMQNVSRPGGSAVDARTTRHTGYEISQKKRPLIDEVRRTDAQGQAPKAAQRRRVISNDPSGFQSLAHPETDPSATPGLVAASPRRPV